MVELPLEWTRVHSDLQALLEEVDYVHVYRDVQELLDMKAPSYYGRTTLSVEGLTRGDMSLGISNVTWADSGRYKCYLPTVESFTMVRLLGELRHVAPSSIIHIN